MAMSNAELMDYVEYAMWNQKISADKRQEVLASLHNILDMYSHDEIVKILEEDKKKYGDA